MFKYYEDGTDKTITFRKAYRMFTVMVDDNQKAQGTTFTSWLSEMEKLQILIRISQNNYFIQECENMKANTYYLFDNGKKIAFSGSFERLLNKTTKTENAEIYYNNVLVWKQNPQKGVNNGKDFIIYKKIQW